MNVFRLFGLSGLFALVAGALSAAPATIGDVTVPPTVLRGKVVFRGDPPPEKEANIPADNIHRQFCMKAGTKDPVWKISRDRGVANAVVWLRPAEGQAFDLTPEQVKPAREVVEIDQPCCAFVPHVAVLFPNYYSPALRKMQPTGQVLKISNSAPIVHNSNLAPHNTLINGAQARNNIMRTGAKPLTLNLRSGRKAGEEDWVTIRCNIHPWMSAYVWVFDHPFAAVTKEDGTYEIKNVPEGVDLRVVHWHETFDKPRQEKVKLHKGINTKNFEVTKP